MIYTILESALINDEVIQMKIKFEYDDSTDLTIDMAVFSPMSVDEVKDAIVNRGNTEKIRIDTAARLATIVSELPINLPIS